MWSIGVLLYTVIAGYPPFEAESNDELYNKIIAGEYLFKGREWDCLPEAKNLIYELMKYDKHERIDASTAVNHDFFKNIILNNNRG